MNRHLAVVELDARLFDSGEEAGRYIERVVARALQTETPRMLLEAGLCDPRPVVTYAADDPDRTLRVLDGEQPDVTTTDTRNALGYASNAALIGELARRASAGRTDRGLTWAALVDA